MANREKKDQSQSSVVQKDGLFPRTMVVVAVLTTSVVFCVMVAAAVFGYAHVATNQKKLHNLQSAYHKIINFDETRMTTVLFAVTLNNIELKQKYDQIQATISSGIEELRQFLTSTQEANAMAAVVSSSTRLSALEKHMYLLLAQGNHEAAYGIVIGSEYANELATYYRHAQELSDIISERIDSETRYAETYSFFAVFFILLLSPIITFLWIIIFLLYRKKKRDYDIAKMELTKAHEQYRNLIELSNDGIIVFQDGLVKFGNKRLFTLFGYEPRDIINKPFIDFVAPEFKKIVGERYAARLAGKNVPTRYELAFLSKTGGYIPIMVSVCLTSLNNRIATMALIEDMRQEKQLEQMRYDFVSIASHQLRTPLTGIKWFSELLLADKKKKFTRAQKDYVENIYHSNQRMIRLIDDLLDVSHIQEGAKFSIKQKEVNIVKLVHEAIRRQAALAKSKHIAVRCLAKKSEKIMVHVDGEKIMQVFQNLLSNAIKYSPKGSVIEVGCAPKKREFIFFVRDHGIGIPQDEQSRVFEKFFRGANVKTREEGTGLGLYIVKAIVEGHGGKLWFKSQENKGTTFYFSLPIIS